MDKSKCHEKCLMILENGNFKMVDYNSTKKNEEKIQQILLKIKNRLSQQEYLHLHPSGSCPGKFYRTAKVHKILQMTKLTNFQYSQLFQTLELLHTI